MRELETVIERLRFKQSCASPQSSLLPCPPLLLLPIAWVWSLRLGQLSAPSPLPEIWMWRESVKLKVKCAYNVNRNVDCEYRLKICGYR